MTPSPPHIFSYCPENLAQHLQTQAKFHGLYHTQAPEELDLSDLIHHTRSITPYNASEERDPTGLFHFHVTNNDAEALTHFPQVRKVTYLEPKSQVFPLALTTLPNLLMLSMQENRKVKKLHKNIASIKGLKGLHLALPNLKDLTLPDSFETLSFLSLDHLTKVENFEAISTLPHLSHLELKEVEIAQTKYDLHDLTNLHTLRCERCSWESYHPEALMEMIQTLSSLTTLKLLHNHLGHLPLPKLDDLTSLTLDHTKELADDFFTHTKNLTTLRLRNHGTAKLPSNLGELVHLQHLDLASCHHSLTSEALASLENLSSLKMLSLAHSDLHATPDSLSALTKLQQLDLGVSPIEDLTSISALPSLTHLNMNHCIQFDHMIDVLATLPTIHHIEVHDNFPLEKVANHPTLKSVRFSRTPKFLSSATEKTFDISGAFAFLKA